MAERERTKVLGLIPGTMWYETYLAGPVVWAEPNKLSDIQTISDNSIPNFASRIAKGEIINNPCTITRKRDDKQDSFSLTWTNDANPDVWWRYYGTGFTASRVTVDDYIVPAYDKTELENKARIVALANIDKTPYAFGEDIGEIRETIQFLRHPLEGLADLGLIFQKEAWSLLRTMDHMTAIAEAWLTVRFAAVPLVRSLGEAMKAATTDLEKYPNRLTARGFANSSDNSKEETDLLTATMSAKIQYHASILYEISNPARDWRFKLGLRVKDMPVTFWQLMPLSFMVDRVMSVSNSISALTNLADPRVSILAASVRVKEEVNHSFRVLKADVSGYTTSGTFDTYLVKNFLYKRDVWYPTVADAIPGVNLAGLVADATSILDLTALILQRFLNPFNPR